MPGTLVLAVAIDRRCSRFSVLTRRGLRGRDFRHSPDDADGGDHPVDGEVALDLTVLHARHGRGDRVVRPFFSAWSPWPPVLDLDAAASRTASWRARRFRHPRPASSGLHRSSTTVTSTPSACGRRRRIRCRWRPSPRRAATSASSGRHHRLEIGPDQLAVGLDGPAARAACAPVAMMICLALYRCLPRSVHVFRRRMPAAASDRLGRLGDTTTSPALAIFASPQMTSTLFFFIRKPTPPLRCAEHAARALATTAFRSASKPTLSFG
jgi:hypothetical protein